MTGSIVRRTLVLIVALVVVGASSTGLSTTVAAATAPKLSVSRATVAPGETVAISGAGFGSSRAGTLRFDGVTIASFKTRSNGTFSLSWTIPARTTAGSHVLSASTSTGTANTPLAVHAPSMPEAPSIAFGAHIDGSWDPAKIDAYAAMVGRMPAILLSYQHWGLDVTRSFDRAAMDAAVARGAMPLVTWEPWDPAAGVEQPGYALRTIVAGNHDQYIRRWAQDAAAWGQLLYLRFAHEMNGTWYPWSAGVNGNTSAEYVAAWQRVVSIFRNAGATNVRWVWSANVAYPGSTPFAELYPGDSWVDWVALDGYNWGTSQSWASWQPLVDVFAASYRAVVSMTSKPVMISETASTESGGDKATWITTGLLADLPAHFPRVRAVVWFHSNKETDWRVNSSQAALDAFRSVVAAPVYQGQLP